MVGNFEIAVIGGGLVGAAIAYGLARRQRGVVLLDEGDVAFRASRGNFGLVWVQGKGFNNPGYARWTRLSSDAWPAFAETLEDDTGTSLGYSRLGGLNLCFDQTELDERDRLLATISGASDPALQYEILDQRTLRELLPEIGPRVTGASFCPLDAHVNPLFLLKALHQAFLLNHGTYLPNRPVESIRTGAGAFRLNTPSGALAVGRLVLAAGLGNARLAPMVDLDAPVVPNRGQILVSERVASFLHLPSVQLRQTAEGSILMGDSHEEVGYDEGTSGAVMSAIARRAVQTFPCLSTVRVLRAWGALRVMTRDGFPVYDRSRTHPGAYLATCHSGVTLAAAHAEHLAAWVHGDSKPGLIEGFSAERFNV